MNWLSDSILFPERLFVTETLDTDAPAFEPEFLAEFFGRYSVDTAANTQSIDGTAVIQSYTESDPVLATIFPDNAPLTRFRKASIFDGTLPLERAEGGYVLRCCWPETFIADLQRDPQPEPEWFAGVQIL